MLEVCGHWGSRPSPTDFRSTLDRPSLAADVDAIYAALGGRVLGARRNLQGFKDELTAAWFDADGFRHVFCGEPSQMTIGGMHFVGRYLQVQEHGWGGLAPGCDRTEIAPPIYTLGVRYRVPGGDVDTACPKGYALSLDASEILIEATRALKHMRSRTTGEAMCLHGIAEAGEPSYHAVVVMTRGALRTFYPDASPQCDRHRPAESCLCGTGR